MKKEIECIKVGKSFKEFHEVDNDTCPMCKKDLSKHLSNIVKLGSCAFCLDCYYQIKK